MGSPAQPSRTAEITAAMRFGETSMPAHLRLFDDPYARAFLRRPEFRIAALSPRIARVAHRAFDRRYGGMNVEHHLRHRFYEETLAEVCERGLRQVMLVGAGYDSITLRRAFADAVIYEVDAPPTQAVKRKVVEELAVQPLNEVRYVACDFETDDIAERVNASGFNPDEPCAAIWMGVSYYLSPGAVESTLNQLAELSCAGSKLIYDYMDASVIAGHSAYAGARRAARSVAKRGEPYVFGLDADRVVAFTEQFGYRVDRSLRVADLVDDYGPQGTTWCSQDDFMGVVLATRVTQSWQWRL